MLSADYEVHEELFSTYRSSAFRSAGLGIFFWPSGRPAQRLFRHFAAASAFLRSLGLRAPVASRFALSDLEVSRAGRKPSIDTHGFDEIGHAQPLTSYQS